MIFSENSKTFNWNDICVLTLMSEENFTVIDIWCIRETKKRDYKGP